MFLFRASAKTNRKGKLALSWHRTTEEFNVANQYKNLKPNCNDVFPGCKDWISRARYIIFVRNFPLLFDKIPSLCEKWHYNRIRLLFTDHIRQGEIYNFIFSVAFLMKRTIWFTSIRYLEYSLQSRSNVFHERINQRITHLWM